jgi:hypothetical protein
VADTRHPDSRRWAIIGLLSLEMTVAYLSRSKISVALAPPACFVEQSHLSLSKMGLYTFFSFGGWAADRMIARGGNPVGVRKWFTIAGFVVACTEPIGAQSSSATVALLFAVVPLSGPGLAMVREKYAPQAAVERQ